MIKWFLLAFIYAASAAAQTSSLALQQRLDRLLSDDFYQRATIGISVYDLTEQRSLYTFNDKRLSRPASNMKVLTSAAALTALTADYSFKTGLYYTGDIDDTGRLYGNLYLFAGFDPELTSANLDELIAHTRNAGIKSISGTLYLNASMADSTHWGRAWSWDDDLEAFQPYLSPVPLNKGIARLRITPSTTGRAPTIRTTPESSFIQVINHATTIQRSSEPTSSTLNFSRDFVNGYNRIVVSGAIAATAGAFEARVSLKDPYAHVLTIFSEKLLEQFPESAIRTAGTTYVPDYAKNLGYAANSIADVIRRLNKESDNLNGEMLLYAMGYHQGAMPTSAEKGIEVVQQFVSQIGLDPAAYRIVDGSGLSNQNILSPELMVEVLKHMHQSPYFNIFRQSMPIAGVDGTLINRMRNTVAARTVMAKTGSLTGVSALSGYVTARNGNLLAFSIMVQNFSERTSFVATNYIDRICVALAEY